MLHVRTDDDGVFLEVIKSGLNNCLTVEANMDQPARMFRQDIISSMFRDGVAAIVPVDTTLNPVTSSFDIKTMRVGRVVEWRAKHVKVSLYNEIKARREEIWLEKSIVGIVENPLYDVMNEHNSTLRRLVEKLTLLDTIDKQSGSGKLDIIVQLPFVVKGEVMSKRAEQRRIDVENQMANSKYGIAYMDGSEKITQLNRPAENNLLAQVEYLMAMLYNQLGLTVEVMNGTADEAAMLNYYHRTIDPVVTAVIQAMNVKFLTKTARTQNQTIMYFNDPFKFVPMAQLAEIVDKLMRNGVVIANEIRPKIGFKPSKDPKANVLGNPNMPADKQQVPTEPKQLQPAGAGGSNQNGA